MFVIRINFIIFIFGNVCDAVFPAIRFQWTALYLTVQYSFRMSVVIVPYDWNGCLCQICRQRYLMCVISYPTTTFFCLLICLFVNFGKYFRFLNWVFKRIFTCKPLKNTQLIKKWRNIFHEPTIFFYYELMNFVLEKKNEVNAQQKSC